MRNAKWVALTGALTLGMSAATMGHQVKEEPQQSYRQSYFALIGANFGPIAAMVQGKMPYSTEGVQERADNLKALSMIDVTSAFSEGSDQGTTRAKPEIWSNTADFKSKFANMQEAIRTLHAAEGDQAAVSKAVGGVGRTCKACHDEYKAKDYLY
jgi:cytochrome c556